ncbi:hypothetical protein E2P81_ATG00944 [Venturia nashicola]|uniref:Tat pathway signal sequence n=1 Tax=Venturia nashicola TaxID=86259 RepID=A0A4Z1PAN6_9PEZI|nr:hypothetical protein E6O75_ATG00965 [Venturia nashicola]TLD38401.1 hypothetical protein E2P81_ATG00944 [Venturia nashicola]
MGPNARDSEHVKYGLLDNEARREGSDVQYMEKPKRRFAYLLPLLCLLNIVLFLISTFSLLKIEQILAWEPRTINNDLKKINSFSPLLEHLDLPLHTQKVDGSLFNTSHSIFRQEPSKAVDAAWDAISNIGIFTITTDEVKRLGKDPSRVVKAPESWGKGPNAYLAQLDTQHTLHCLNAIRKHVYFDYYFSPKYASHSQLPKISKVHLAHCLHIVLQNLLCQPSTGVITFDWVETQENPFPDFSIQRKCVDHDSILEWQRERNVASVERWRDIRRPEGAVVREADEGLLEWVRKDEGL